MLHSWWQKFRRGQTAVNHLHEEVVAARAELTQNTAETAAEANKLQRMLRTYAGAPNPMMELTQLFVNHQAMEDRK